MKIIALTLVCLILFTWSAAAVDLNVSTPWNDPEKWQDTWQKETYIYFAGGFSNFCNKLGKFALWFAKEKMEGKKKQARKERQQKNNSDDPLERMYLQKFKVYEKLSKEADSMKEIERIIEHIEKYGYQEYGDNLNKKFKELHDDLEHIRDTHYKITMAGYSVSMMAIMGFLAKLGQLAILGL